EGDSAQETATATAEGRIVLPRQRKPDVAPELDAIARHALAPATKDRTETAKAFADDVRAFLEGGAVSVYRYRPAEQAIRLVNRPPTIFVAVAVAVALTAAAAIVLGFKNQALSRTLAAYDAERVAREAAEKARAETEEASARIAEARMKMRQG